jgi:hypothetical protein
MSASYPVSPEHRRGHYELPPELWMPDAETHGHATADGRDSGNRMHWRISYPVVDLAVILR